MALALKGGTELGKGKGEERAYGQAGAGREKGQGVRKLENQAV